MKGLLPTESIRLVLGYFTESPDVEVAFLLVVLVLPTFIITKNIGRNSSQYEWTEVLFVYSSSIYVSLHLSLCLFTPFVTMNFEICP